MDGLGVPQQSLGDASLHGTQRRRGYDQKQDRGAHSLRPLRPLKIAAVALLALVVTAAVATFAAVRWSTPALDRADALSVSVLDRHDRLLRAFTTPDGRWRLPLDTKSVDPRYLAMLVAYEDKRYYKHGGVDGLALSRATRQLVTHGRIVSGASTLTMQTARLLDGEHARSGLGKLRQMVRAWQLERRFSKGEILNLYLRLAPFGGNVEGTRAAALAYFGKEPRRLSIAEAALLVAIPQSPEARRPDRHPERARRARDRVLARALDAGVITAEEAADARRERVPTVRREFPKLAPHLAETEIKRAPDRRIHRLTLDRDAQAQLEPLVREHAQALGPKLSAAVLAIDHATGEVIAHVGSAGYLDDSRQGAIDMTDAVRSPGSTLKPLVYGLAFELGLAHPETLIEDRPARFGLYHPKNFDEDFHGTVSIREALAQSLNIPAVKVLASVGPKRLVGRLRRLNLTTALPQKTEPTLAIALGGIGMKLSDLATLYASLARGGDPVRLAHLAERPRTHYVKPEPMRRLLAPSAAWHVGNILKDAPPPANARGGGIAYKTGTSYGFRDAWAAGYDGRFTVAVWVGRPDGTAVPGLSGRVAAAPLLFDAFARLAERPTPLPSAPAGTLRATTAKLPPNLRRFKEPGDDAATDGPYLETAVQIAFPPDRSELETDAGSPGQIVLKADGGALPLTWLIDGQPIATDPTRREALWSPEGLGFARISVIDAKGRADRVDIRLK